ncbi:importin-7 [Nematocida sp. LUAm3]|nr:importin-7 [Nematocida sp. LUAm3]KAI5176386.1 importin-7 [Nematocida sp. LUAm2]KAI5179046.1 importin-7 [Nematocida sp. LUAm1]
MTVQPKTNLRECVAMTLQPEIETKRVGETHLEQLSKAPGFLENLLHLSCSDKESGVRLVSSVYFRRYLEKFWSSEGFSKAEVIQSFPSFLLSSSREAERQMYSALDFVLKEETAESWMPIIHAAEELIANEREEAFTTGLKILNRIVVAFVDGYKSEKAFTSVLDRAGGKLLEIGTQATALAKYPISALVLKILAHSCESYIIPNLFNDQQMLQKIIGLADICSAPILECPSMTKWAFKLMNNLMKKTKVTKKKASVLEPITRPEVVKALYHRSHEVLRLYKENECSEKVEREALNMIKLLVGKDSGWELIKPDCPSLISAYILPSVAFDSELEDVWEESQIEFLRQQETQYYHSKQTVASELFMEICKKSKDTPDLLNVLFSVVLREISIYTTQPTEEHANIRYGGLSLFKKAGKHAYKNDSIYGMVLEDLRAPHARVKYMAFSTLQDLIYHKQPPFSVLEPFMAGVASTDIAVIVESVLCLPSLLEIPSMKESLTPHVTSFIRLILDLSNRVQIEALSGALEDVILICPEQAFAIAPAIAQAISVSILQLLREEEEHDVDEKYSVIDGYIRTIVTLVDSLEGSPQSIIAVISSVKPMILEVAEKHEDFFSEILPLIVSSSYALKNVDSMYDILEKILKMDIGDLSLYTGEISGVLDNFLSYGKQGMLRYIGDILRILNGLLEGYSSEYDFPYICRIMESMILNIYSLLGEQGPAILQSLLKMILSNKESLRIPSGLISGIEVILCAFIACPRVTLLWLIESQELSFVVKSISENYKKFERVHDLKLLLLFSGMLLQENPSNIPAEIHAELLIALFHHAVTLFPGALAKREALQNGEEEYDEEYYDQEYFEEDPTYQTPLDSIDPYAYGTQILQSPNGSVFSQIWMHLSEQKREEIQEVLVKK